MQLATNTLVSQNASISTRMQEALDEERRQSAEERQKLMAQVTTLINTQADAQETRIADRAAQVQKNLAESSQSLEGTISQYAQGMNAWDEKEDELLESVRKSRDQLKTKLKDDWTSANDKSTSIQNTAKSVHAETVRVVDEQIEDLDVQMESLDDFVSRAKLENANHHESHAQSVKIVSSTVEQSFENISTHFETTFGRIKNLGEAMELDVNDLHEGLEPLDAQICQPLANLREEIGSTSLQEYQPTGATPQKAQYQYPTSLPRTQRQSLLVSQIDDDETIAGSDVPEEKEHTIVFADLDPLVNTDCHSRPSTTSTTAASDDKTTPLSAMSLREVNPNVTTNLTTGVIGSLDTHSDIISVPADHTLPLFKPSARNTRGVKTQGPVGEGRENLPPSAFSQSISRRKSPRLN